MEKTKIGKNFITVVFAFLTVAVLATAPVAATDSVGSAADWEKYVMNHGDSHSDVDIILSEDIVLTNVLCAENKYLKNVKINGNNHKITLNLNDTASDNVALISRVENGTVEITNLTVEGSAVMKHLAGKNRAAGLIAYVKGGNCSFKNVSVNNINIVSGGSVGGFIGYATSGAIIKFETCEVNRSHIKASTNYYAGGFIGWEDNSCIVKIIDSLVLNSDISAEKVTAGGFVGCAAGEDLVVSKCKVSDCEIYSACGQTGGVVGFLESNLEMENVTIINTKILTTAAPPLTNGSYLSAKTDKFIGVGGLVGEMNGDEYTLTATGTTITTSIIASNRENVNYIIGCPSTPILNGVIVSKDTKLEQEITQERNPELYDKKTAPKVAKTPFPLSSLLAGLGIVGLLIRQRKI